MSSNVAGLPFYMKLTGILPMLRLEIGSSTDVNTALVICDACCTHSWVPENLAQRLKLTGQKIDNPVNCSKLTELVSTQKVELNVFAKLDHHEQSLRVTQFFKEILSVDSETIDIPILKDSFQHLELIKPFVYNYFDLQMIFYGRMIFRVIKHLEYFQGGNQNTPVAVHKPIGWVLSGPLHSPSGFGVTTFKCIVEDIALADQLKKGYVRKGRIV